MSAARNVLVSLRCVFFFNFSRLFTTTDCGKCCGIVTSIIVVDEFTGVMSVRGTRV